MSSHHVDHLSGDAEHHLVPLGVFHKVLAALFVLTAITVSGSIYFPGAVGVGVAIIVTPIKAALVLAFFMHLKYETHLYRWMIYSAVGILVSFLVLTFVDYIYRGQYL